MDIHLKTSEMIGIYYIFLLKISNEYPNNRREHFYVIITPVIHSFFFPVNLEALNFATNVSKYCVIC